MAASRGNGSEKTKNRFIQLKCTWFAFREEKRKAFPQDIAVLLIIKVGRIPIAYRTDNQGTPINSKKHKIGMGCRDKLPGHRERFVLPRLDCDLMDR